MREGCLYRHVDCRDAALYVTFVTTAGRSLLVSGEWWNIGACHEPWPMNIRQNVVIEYPHEWVLMGVRERLPPPPHRHLDF